MSRIKELKKLLAKMPATEHQNVIGSNSKITYQGGKYKLFCGNIESNFSGSFEEVRDYLQQEIDLWHTDQK